MNGRVRRGSLSAVAGIALVMWAGRGTAHGDHGTLVVQVRSDVTAPDGFDRIVTSSSDGDGNDVFDWVSEARPRPGQNFAAGVRILEIHDYFHNLVRLEVSMMKGSCVVASRAVIVGFDGGVEVVTVVLTKETPTLTWATPSSIRYGTPLGGVQLNATASSIYKPRVPGTFDYSPPAGTVLPAGFNPITVRFTGSNPASYHPVEKTVLINVTKRPLTIRAQDKIRPRALPTRRSPRCTPVWSMGTGPRISIRRSPYSHPPPPRAAPGTM